jgi:amidohydrolase
MSVMKTGQEHGSLVSLRRHLHKYPELSGLEQMTSAFISDRLAELRPDELISGIGGHGLAARFTGKVPGIRVMVRAELDALPIGETNDFGHRSANAGVSHKCGHDGHMAVTMGIANHFGTCRPPEGEVVVLFQPAEENGQGARAVIEDPAFAGIEPDFIIAMHNLPGFDLHEIVLKENAFAAASEGMIVYLMGKTSHASQPENGLSPSVAMARIMQELPLLAVKGEFSQATIIHARLGEIAFGTNPGEAVIMVTLRAFDGMVMEKMKKMAYRLVHDIALSEKLRVSVKWVEAFPVTTNDPYLVYLARETAGELNYQTRMMEDPFRWSEDFGWFTGKFRGMLFGIGAGRDHPELHNPDYDFPDEIITTGVSFIGTVCSRLLKQE